MSIQKYSGAQIALHWAIAVLIVANWFMGEGMGGALRAHRAGEASVGTPWHVWLGVTILVLVLLRLVVRFGSGAPAPAPGTPPLLVLASIWGHRLLYLLMLAVPASGMAAWFGGIAKTGGAHELLVNILVVVVVAHTAAGLFHHYVLRDGLIARMMPGR